MKWTELYPSGHEFGKPYWDLGEDRTKNGQRHIVPLTPHALTILNSIYEIENDDQLVFTTNGKTNASGFSKAKTRLDAIMNRLYRDKLSNEGKNPEDCSLEHWTIHDLRRTASTYLARTGAQVHISERILNHISGTFSGIVSVYQLFKYVNECRDALQNYNEFIFQLVGERAPTCDNLYIKK